MMPPPLACEASEKAQRLRAVAHQQALGLLVVGQGHLVGFAADAGLLVTAKGGVRRVHVIAVGPDAAGFDAATYPVGLRAVAAPYAGPQAVVGVVGDSD